MTTTVNHEHVPDEDHPNGAAWRKPRPTPPPTGLPAHIRPCTPDEQARHLADLADAISTWVYRPTRRTTPPGATP